MVYYLDFSSKIIWLLIVFIGLPKILDIFITLIQMHRQKEKARKYEHVIISISNETISENRKEDQNEKNS